MNNLSSISEKISDAKSLEFGDIFDKSMELFKKSWLYGFLLEIFILIITLPFIIVLYVPFVMSIIADSKQGKMPDGLDSLFAGFTVFYLVLFVLGILAATVFQTALNAGFYRILRAIDQGETVKASDLFYFLKGKYFGRVTMLTFMVILISLISALLCYIPLIYTIIPISFFTIVFAFNPEMQIGDIVNISFKLGTKKWLISFGLFVVANLLVIVLTLLTCGIGALFLSPFIYLPLYFVYKQVVGFDEETTVEIHE
ncbi:hypothetical protein GCM10007962_01560 [Yeosuana aromativorans]|uniref:Glycerophosphoryl diester phosphodiesterase membrane domain-containing protein n=1 Tax=Yeosuana aromativorans TaxID=288019 RepID=A0A8J3BIJ7_9FLAO|nr:hypothetical protein [Yeosuana aromativorans]GGK11106.1 hypothetical protein GCM10007962_01560 [Yeosuana aromativorans]